MRRIFARAWRPALRAGPRMARPQTAAPRRRGAGDRDRSGARRRAGGIQRQNIFEVKPERAPTRTT